MNELKIYKELVAIKLKDGRVLTSDASVREVQEMLNKNDFIVVGDVGFTKYEVRMFEKFIPTEIECFIYSQPKEIADKLKSILEERKSKNYETNSVKHLRDIYESREKNEK